MFQEKLGDVVFIELPNVSQVLEAGGKSFFVSCLEN